MTANFDPAELLASLAAAGARIAVRGIRLHIDAPKGVLTPPIKLALHLQKSALVALCRLDGPCDGCGCPDARDVAIHDGRSTRRDCALCGRTWGFPVWEQRIIRLNLGGTS